MRSTQPRPAHPSGALSAGRTQCGRQAYAFVTSRVTCTTRPAAPGGFLKVLANSTSYGIFAEMNRQELGSGKKERVSVYGLDPEPFVTEVTGPEEPGAYCSHRSPPSSLGQRG